MELLYEELIQKRLNIYELKELRKAYNICWFIKKFQYIN